MGEMHTHTRLEWEKWWSRAVCMLMCGWTSFRGMHLEDSQNGQPIHIQIPGMKAKWEEDQELEFQSVINMYCMKSDQSEMAENWEANSSTLAHFFSFSTLFMNITQKEDKDYSQQSNNINTHPTHTQSNAILMSDCTHLKLCGVRKTYWFWRCSSARLIRSSMAIWRFTLSYECRWNK